MAHRAIASAATAVKSARAERGWSSVQDVARGAAGGGVGTQGPRLLFALAGGTRCGCTAHGAGARRRFRGRRVGCRGGGGDAGRRGFTIDRTPEDWLFKACADGAVVDVLHRINGVRSTPP
ncbi:hypothetical protein I553_3870 [Mycobacterium xenopi 4042]|uniref:Uncharacterized protein n=1 Tax=Mycobacterium xenopi 4042 TaxID=1299334 RepID=X8EF97_MYCXE|nr:hypothetical protein I553_3870 [Mycobacterium xenopi 4042]